MNYGTKRNVVMVALLIMQLLWALEHHYVESVILMCTNMIIWLMPNNRAENQ